MTRENKTKSRIQEIDYLRGIAILAVIAIHTSPGGRYELAKLTLDQTYFIAANKLTRFAVPFFIIISGIALSYKYRITRKNYARFIWKRASHVLIPYTLFTGIYYYKLHITIGETPSLIALTYHLLRGSAAPHLYFVVLIFQLYLLFPLFIGLTEFLNKQRLIVQMILFSGILLSLPVIILKYNMLSRGFPTILPVGHYFLIGCLIGSKIDKFENIITYQINSVTRPAFIMFTSYLFLDATLFYQSPSYKNWMFNFYFIGITGFTLSLFSLLWACASSNREILKYLPILGRYSYGIYLSHYLFVKTLAPIVPFPTYSALHSIIFFSLVLSLSYLSALTLSKNKLLAVVGGVPFKN